MESSNNNHNTSLSDGDHQQQQQHLQSRITTQSNEVLPHVNVQQSSLNQNILAGVSDPASNTSEAARWAQDELSEEDFIRASPHHHRSGLVIEQVVAPHLLVTRNLSVIQTQRGMHSYPLSPQNTGHLEVSDRTAVFAFGQNSYGELGIEDEEDRFIPAEIRFFRNIQVQQVGAGNEHTAVVTTEGHVYTFGFNGSGQLGVGDTRSLCHPRRIEFQRGRPLKVNGVVCANGCEHMAFIGETGSLYTCGYNNYGQLGLGTSGNVLRPTLVESLANRRVVAASCSYYHTAVVCTSLPANNEFLED